MKFSDTEQFQEASKSVQTEQLQAQDAMWRQLRDLNKINPLAVWGVMPDLHMDIGEYFICCDVLEFVRNDACELFTSSTPEAAVQLAYNSAFQLVDDIPFHSEVEA